MKKRCDKCGGQLLELWDREKTAVWIACAVCDKPELDDMKRRKMADDVDKIMGIKDKGSF